MLWELHQLRFSPLAYADDTNISFQARDENLLKEVANDALQKIGELSQKYEITFNIKKTEVIVFSRLRTKYSFKLSFLGEEISLANKVKYLGVIFDSKLNWEYQLQTVKNKVAQNMGCLGKMGGWGWGIKPSQRMDIVRRAIFPSCFYALPIWCMAFSTISGRQKLLSAIRPCLLYVTSLLSTTSSDVMLALLRLPSMFFLLALNTTKQIFSYRLHEIEYSETKYTSFLFSLPSSVHLDQFSSKSLSPSQALAFPPHLFPSPSVVISHRQNALLQAINSTSNYAIFTDGSKTPQSTGAAFVAFRSNNVVSEAAALLPDYMTVYQAETFAVAQALQWAVINLENDTDLSIFVDSQDVLMSLRDHKPSSISHFRIFNALHRLSLIKVATVFLWCPAHSNVFGNERADYLAKNAVDPQPPSLLPSPSASYLRKILARDASDVQFSDWCSLNLNTYAKFFFPTRHHFFVLISLHDQLSPYTVQLLLGHHLLKARLHEISKDVSPLCTCGDESETVLHYIFQCPKFDSVRSSLRSLSPIFPFPLATFTSSTRSLIVFNDFVTRSKRFSQRDQHN